MKFVTDHPELAMTLNYGSSNMCLQPPAGGRPGSFDAKAIRIPEPMANQFGADASRTYTMEEIIELVRPMVPQGFEITESVVANFLGLGAVVNPLEEDLKYYKEFSEQFKEHLKTAKLDAKRLDPPQPKDASFELWSYYHLGVPTFSQDFWTLPEVKEDKKESTGITAESLEAMTSEAFTALGEAKITAFLKEVGAPDSLKATQLLEGVKGGRLTPKMMAGMLKSMPKPKEPGAADPRQKALVAFSDKELKGQGWLDWKPFKHPQLGEVEIGGAVPFADTTPPTAMIEKLLKGQVPWAFKLSEKLPRLKVKQHSLKPKGAGVYGLEVWVENTSLLPWPTAMGQKNQRVGPAVLKLEAKGLQFLAGRAHTPLQAVAGGRAIKLEWLVRVEGKTTVEVVLESPNAWGDTSRIELEGGAK